jgi:D-arabinose 1-dehydrogenase-like Zn-dependent alcohol dehydrogenase
MELRMSACRVCRTDLHLVDAELPDIKYPITPGHEIIGQLDLVGCDVTTHWVIDIANLTRQDGLDFLEVASQAGIQTETTAFPLAGANEVLTKSRSGQLLGAAALRP